MDGVTHEEPDPTSEEAAIGPRPTLSAIVAQCEHALGDRLARRFSTRDALKSLERRASALLEQPDGGEWDKAFAQVVATANEVFGTLMEEVDVAHA